MRKNTSLLLVARQTSILIKDWCLSTRHRIHRMEFMRSLDRRPIVIQPMDYLKCNRKATDENDKDLIEGLNRKFFEAQKQSLLLRKIDDTDVSRSMLCIGSIFADIVTKNSMYKLFGFKSIIDQVSFMRKNCIDLFRKKDFNKLLLSSMRNMLRTQVQLLRLDYSATQREKHLAYLVQKKFKQLNSYCWQRFKLFLLNRKSQIKEFHINYFRNLSHSLSKCIPDI